MMTNVMNQGMECWVNIMSENGIQNESGDLMNYLFSDEWIKIVEHGTK